MVVFSKHQNQVVEDCVCSVIHPWSKNCVISALNTGVKCFRGSANWFFLFYLIPLILKRKFTQDVLLQNFTNFFRSCLFGGFCGGSAIATMCFLRWLLGKHKVLSLGLIPGMVGGCAVFFEHPSRREIDLSLFIALIADLYLQLLNDEGILKLSFSREVFIFSCCSSLLLYCLRSFRGSYTVLWPFPPPKLAKDKKDRKLCSHKGPCLESIKKVGSTYFSFGLVLQAAKVVAFNFKKLFAQPTTFFRIFFNINNLRLPIFAGVYISLLKGVSCLMVKLRGEDEAWHILPAGVIASLSYLIQPNFSLALMALSNVLQVVCREYTKDMKKLSTWPWRELVFIALMGLMFHARAAYPRCFPRYMTTIMDTATDGRAQILYELVDKHIIIRK